MIGDQKQGAGAGAGESSRHKRPGVVEADGTHKAAGSCGERQQLSGGRAQSRIVSGQTPQDEGERDAKENGHDFERSNRDRMRLLEPLAEHYIGWRKASFHVSCGNT
jgi:hypothetical protein